MNKKICIKCSYFKRASFGSPSNKCLHPNNIKVDLVLGGESLMHTPKELRTSNFPSLACNIEGKGFKQ